MLPQLPVYDALIMDNFLDRAAKRQRTEEEEGANTDVQPPSVIVSWNVNSLKIRCERREIGTWACMGWGGWQAACMLHGHMDAAKIHTP